LTFDDGKQVLDDFSSFSNTQYLGISSSIEISDPVSNSGVIFDGVDFDGVDDVINILPNSSLELNNSLTFSAWIKWDGVGDIFQNIFTNGIWENALRVVNDGGINNNKLLFQLNVGGTVYYLYSNVILDNNWRFLTATFDGSEMKLYLDSVLVGNLSVIGSVVSSSGNNYVGSEGAGFYFNGSIDEVKIFNIDLKQEEIVDLYYNNLKFRELDYFIVDFDLVNEVSTIFVKVPAIQANSNITFDLYYDNRDGVNTTSDIENTFSYVHPRRVGYVVSDRIPGTTGLNIMSLYDNNIIYVGNDILNQDEQVGTTLASGLLNQNDEVKMKYLAQVEGNGQGDDMIVPISWAGKEFYFSGFRDTSDRFCMLSPFGTASVEIFDDGVSEYVGIVDGLGSCVTNDITSGVSLRLTSDIPILVSYYGDGTNQDAFAMLPVTNDDLFGIPSRNLYGAAGPSGANVVAYESSGITSSYSLGVNGVFSDGSNGAGDGDANAYKLVSDLPIGAIQQADGDGTESTVFVSKYEFGVKFGSNEEADYIAVVSDSSDANCSVYDSIGSLLGNQVNGVGTNGVYKYDFGTGNDNTYTNSGGWKIECDGPVWPYYENRIDNDDETNLFGHLQMRQYVYPEPVVVIE